ncbi:MAG: hypothetical protein WAL30_01045 [Candidatus Aquirickettsiella sp.]
MDKKMITGRQNFFPLRNIKQKEGKYIKLVNQLDKKSIYNLTWNAFYKELHRLGMKEFLQQYGYAYKKKLQLVIARSNLSLKKITLYDFERNTELGLFALLGNSFFDKVTQQPNFNAKQHKLSTIHYYMYQNSLHFAAISLGFASKQCFLNFFAQTHYMSEYVENRVQDLRVSLQSLHEVDLVTLRKELGYLYDEPLVQNTHFIKYNYTLEELKRALEKESIVILVASLGGGTSFCVNKKLQTLRPVINVSLQELQRRSWETLMENTPILIWKIKLYQLFSGQNALEQATRSRPNDGRVMRTNFGDTTAEIFREHSDSPVYRPRTPYISCTKFQWQFFISQHTQTHSEETDTLLNLHNFSSSSYSTEMTLRANVYQY